MRYLIKAILSRLEEITGKQVYYNTAPESVEMPYTVINTDVFDTPQYMMSSSTILEQITVNIMVFDNSYNDACEIIEAIESSFENNKLTLESGLMNASFIQGKTEIQFDDKDATGRLIYQVILPINFHIERDL